MQVLLRNFRRAAGPSEKLRSVDRPCRAPHRLSLSFASTAAHRSAEIALALACSVDAMKAQEHVHRGVSRRPCATPLRITSSPRVWALCLSFRALSPRTQPRISHACPLCSQTRPLITPSHAPSFALPPRMRAPVPSLLSDTPSRSVLCPLTSHARTRALSALRHALSLRPLLTPSHALLRALSPRMHALSRALTPSHLACTHACPLHCSQARPLNITPSHALLSRPLTTHACPLTPFSHLACMPSLSSSLTRPRF